MNHAERQELAKLPLNALAIDRIIENRPYRNKLELISRMAIPKELYSKIRHRIGITHLASNSPQRATTA